MILARGSSLLFPVLRREPASSWLLCAQLCPHCALPGALFPHLPELTTAHLLCLPFSEHPFTRTLPPARALPPRLVRTGFSLFESSILMVVQDSKRYKRVSLGASHCLCLPAWCELCLINKQIRVLLSVLHRLMCYNIVRLFLPNLLLLVPLLGKLMGSVYYNQRGVYLQPSGSTSGDVPRRNEGLNLLKTVTCLIGQTGLSAQSHANLTIIIKA